ncbi:MAG TPA: NAD(P)-binding domain-containing protein [Nocardioidaceae bacterium]|nr:NAD(P)-binding domain-containing protein [Nocardioidaceae bacterium]
MSRTPVTVIGLGPMGRAMAGAFLDAGHPTTVFNRTPGKNDDLVRTGARRADSAAGAIAAADLVVLSLTHYEAMYELLGSATRELAGKTLVNLSSDAPSEAERAAAWAAEHGADLVAGGIMVPAALVATPEAYAFYSGPAAVVERHRTTLEVLSRVDYRGEQPGLALLWYQALLDLFMTTLASIQHASALVGSADVPAETFLPYASGLMSQLPYFMEGMAEEIDGRAYPDKGASLAMMSAGIDHIVHASEDAGIDPGLPGAVRDLYRRAIADGRREQSSTSIIEMIKNPEGKERAA